MEWILIVGKNRPEATERIAQLREIALNADYAQTTVEASSRMNYRTYALLIIDDDADGSGLSWCCTLRSRYFSPILLLTDGSSDAELAGLHAGADDCIGTSAPAPTFQAHVRALLRRQRWSAQGVSVLHSGEVRIDLTQKTIALRGHVLPIHGMEYRLCVILAENSGTVLPRARLSAQLENTADNTLSVMVSRLRKKVGKCGETPYISTVKFIGYRWNMDTSAE